MTLPEVLQREFACHLARARQADFQLRALGLEDNEAGRTADALEALLAASGAAARVDRGFRSHRSLP